MDQIQEHNDEVEFQDGASGLRSTTYTKKSSMASWLMRHSFGVIQSEEQANYFLLGFAVALIIVALIVLHAANKQVVPTSGAVPVGQIVP